MLRVLLRWGLAAGTDIVGDGQSSDCQSSSILGLLRLGERHLNTALGLSWAETNLDPLGVLLKSVPGSDITAEVLLTPESLIWQLPSPLHRATAVLASSFALTLALTLAPPPPVTLSLLLGNVASTAEFALIFACLPLCLVDVASAIAFARFAATADFHCLLSRLPPSSVDQTGSSRPLPLIAY